MITVAELRAHIDKKFEGKTVTPFPSPHLEIENFFPDEVYKEIIAKNPFSQNVGTEWISSDEMKKRRQDTPYDRRKQVDLKNEFSGSSDVKSFWSTLREALLGDNWFAQRMYKTFPAYFDIRFGEAMLEPKFWNELRNTMFVQRHETGYHIGPHTDTPHRVFTCIFAFADDNKFEDYGTRFLRPKDGRARCWGDLHYKEEDFEVAKVAKYRPNNFVVFFKTRQAFHSVKGMAEALPNERYGMQLAYYEPPQGVFHELSRPDIMADRTTKPLFEMKAFGRHLQLHRSLEASLRKV